MSSFKISHMAIKDKQENGKTECGSIRYNSCHFPLADHDILCWKGEQADYFQTGVSDTQKTGLKGVL